MGIFASLLAMLGVLFTVLGSGILFQAERNIEQTAVCFICFATGFVFFAGLYCVGKRVGRVQSLNEPLVCTEDTSFDPLSFEIVHLKRRSSRKIPVF